MVDTQSPADRLKRFLAEASQYQLGELVTEQPHPLTAGLSAMAVEAPGEALALLQRVDAEALDTLGTHVHEIEELARQVGATVRAGGRVFVCGCGATGRLALSCEVLWRRAHAGDGLAERVVGFMAGGDAALVRSIENAEDHPEYGARHLRELGFGEHDLLIAVTEGGETPYVIGATLAGRALSPVKPVFLYCNPDEVLCRVAQRSAQVIGDPGITKVNLTVGPMALTGSTRMQATSVQMAAVGAALLHCDRPECVHDELGELRKCWALVDTRRFAPFAVAESERYAQGGRVTYVADREFAITVLTDTTERSPTFSMPPFANKLDPSAVDAPCGLVVKDTAASAMAWEAILERAPRPLDWQELAGRSSSVRLLGFDFSEKGLPGGGDGTRFVVGSEGDGVRFTMGDHSCLLDMGGATPLCRHLVVKMVLNAHSTVVMGRLGRYDGNVMTWVRPTCNKLVDRAIRYAGLILHQRGVDVPYEQIAAALFEVEQAIPANASIVDAIVRRLRPGVD